MWKTFAISCSLFAFSGAQEDYTQYVDVFYGTTNGGNMFPGVVAAPFAAVKLGPDVEGENARSGYAPKGKINGFSLMHLSGTGGSPKYGTVSQMPVVGNISSPLDSLSVDRSSPDNGTVGYYRTNLSNGVTVELAATEHVGFYKYAFPANVSQYNVVVDASHFLSSKQWSSISQTYTHGSIETFPDGHYEGSTSIKGGWNLASEWTIFFCGQFNSTAVQTKTFSGVDTNLTQFGTATSLAGIERVGAVFTFKERYVTSKVGVSWISARRACAFVDSETNPSTTLEQLVQRSRERWNQVLSKISTTESNRTTLEQLYTNLYGMHLLPSNRTGENPNPRWNQATPYYDDIYTLWDLYRSMTPLLHILQPKMYEDLIRSFIGSYQAGGYMPDGRSSNYNGRVQGGSSADNVLADAYVKGVRGQVDWKAGYAAMVKNAEITPANNNDGMASDSSTHEGRGALPDWLNLGFISTRFSRSVSRAIEYSSNDFGLAQVAKRLGKKSDASKYMARSRNWRNHWDTSTTSKNISGFVVPRKSNGSLVVQDPMSCGGCYWGDAYYEGKPWEYSVNAHHDIATLIELGNGTDNFQRRLETLLDPKQGIADMGNEVSFGSPYLFNFINKQALSVKYARDIATNEYHTGPNGLPGNSDAGAMQSWLLWNMIGMYPLTGQTTFLIGSPWMSDLTIDLGNSKSLHITSSGGNRHDAIYVQSLRVNGQQWAKNWVTWQDILANGGTMEFVLGTEMKQWDTGDVPPSPASGSKPALVGADALAREESAQKKARTVSIALGVIGGILALASIAAVYFLWRRGMVWRKTKHEAKSDLEQTTINHPLTNAA